MVIAVTESNNVYALNATNGTALWQQNVGVPVPLSSLPCGDINPLGITGTPIVDLASHRLFLDAMTTPDNGKTKEHLIFALNVDTGAIEPGWPVNVNATAHSDNLSFDSTVQNERGALGIVNGRVYVPYGGHAGDCGSYHGWLVGVALDNPADVMAWATPARGGGSWGVSGVASDGVNPFIATGNTFGASSWAGGEAILRFQSGPVFSAQAVDYWAPTNWVALDNGDTDLGGSGPLLVDVPAAAVTARCIPWKGWECLSLESHQPERRQSAFGKGARLGQPHHPGRGQLSNTRWNFRRLECCQSDCCLSNHRLDPAHDYQCLVGQRWRTRIPVHHLHRRNQ